MLIVRRVQAGLALVSGLIAPGLGYHAVGDIPRTLAAFLILWPLWLLAAWSRPLLDSWWPFAAVLALQAASALDSARRALARRTPPTLPRYSWLWLSLATCGMIAFWLRTTHLQQYQLHGELLPELGSGDYLLVDDLYYHRRPVARGDLVYYRDGQRAGLRRVVGLAGDRVSIHDYAVYRGNAQVSPVDSSLQDLSEVEVPAGSIFLLGDPTHTQWDSRTLGPLPASGVEGRVILVWWAPWSRMGRL